MKKIIDITDENLWTEPMQIGMEGATIMIGNNTSFSGTLTVQYGSTDFDTWIDDITYSSETVDVVRPNTEMYIRIGTKLGDYESGSIKAVIYRGWLSGNDREET